MGYPAAGHLYIDRAAAWEHMKESSSAPIVLLLQYIMFICWDYGLRVEFWIQWLASGVLDSMAASRISHFEDWQQYEKISSAVASWETARCCISILAF